MSRPRLRLVVLGYSVAVAGAITLGWSPAARWWKAGELLAALSSAHAAGGPGAAPTSGAELVEEEVANVAPANAAPVRARLYRRADQPAGTGRGLVVVHGIHHEGMNEHRMVPFARELARAGLVVLTPEVADLADYRITPRGVSVIRDAALYLGERRDLVGDARVGVLGFSFGGGLSLVAAADPALAERLAFVVSVGGHHDLERVLRFLITNEVETPAGVEHRKAHDYGLVVLLYGAVDRFAPAADRDVLREALRASLHGEPDRARAAAARLTTDEGRRLWRLVETQQLQTLAPQLEALVRERRDELAALSPRGRLRSLAVPVYLLHGSGDTVIPPSETEWASRELGDADHIALVSPLLEHVEVNRPAGLANKLALVRFIAHLL
jgi:dienelactone hydrolase